MKIYCSCNCGKSFEKFDKYGRTLCTNCHKQTETYGRHTVRNNNNINYLSSL